MDSTYGINWEEQVKNGGGFFEAEDFGMPLDFHIDLDDEIYGDDYNRMQYFGDGSRSLVFKTPILEEIFNSSSFDNFVSGTTPLTSDSGIRKSVLRSGNGRGPQDGAQVWVHYIAFAERNSGTERELELIDSTLKQKCLNTFKLNGEVIPYMEISVRSMQFNEVSLFIAEPRYAYGRLGCPPRIPADARVLAIVELVAMEASFHQPVFLMNSDERQGLPMGIINEEINRLRAVGKNKFHAEDYDGAIRCYKIAAGILHEYYHADPNYQSMKQNQLYFLASNTAECFLRLEDYKSVIQLYREVIRRKVPCLDGKLIVRYTKALMAKKKYKKALGSVKEALKIEPGHPTILYLLQQIESRIQSDAKNAEFANSMYRLCLEDSSKSDVHCDKIQKSKCPPATKESIPGPSSRDQREDTDLPSLVHSPRPFSAAAGISALYKNKINW